MMAQYVPTTLLFFFHTTTIIIVVVIYHETATPKEMHYTALTCLFMFGLMLNTDASKLFQRKRRKAKIYGMGSTSKTQEAMEVEHCFNCCFFRYNWERGLDAKDGKEADCFDNNHSVLRVMKEVANLCADSSVKTENGKCKGYGTWRSRAIYPEIASYGIIVKSK